MTAPIIAINSNLSFDEAKHEYRAGARVLPGVTTILRETKFYHVPAWINDPKYKQLGKAVHQACHLFDLGLSPAKPYHPDVASRLARYAQFKEDTGFRGMAWEVPLADVQRGYAGTMDTVGISGSGEIWEIDIKTGTVPIVGVSVQLAAYADLLATGRVIPVPRHASLPLDMEWFEWARTQKTNIRKKSLNLTPEAYTLRSHDEPRYRAYWSAALTMYNAWQEHGL